MSWRQRSFAKMHMYCIVLANHPYGSWKRSAWKHTFLKTGLRVEKSENAALPFSCGRRICIISKTTMPLPHPAMSHNKNNNGRLHARVYVAEDIEPFLPLTCLEVECVLQQQFDLINSPYRCFWFPCTSHFHLLLVVFWFLLSTVCLFTARKLNAHALCLLLRFWWMSSATDRPGIWTTAFLVVFSGSVWTQIFLKRCWGRRRKKDRFRTSGRPLRH